MQEPEQWPMLLRKQMQKPKTRFNPISGGESFEELGEDEIQIIKTRINPIEPKPFE